MTELHDAELEWGIIQACCARPAVVGPVLARVRPEDFYDVPARIAMTAVASMHARGQILDKALVVRAMRREHRAESGLELFDPRYELTIPDTAPGHAQHIRALSLLRRVKTVGAEVHSLSSDADPAEVISSAIAALRAAGEQLSNDELTVAELVVETERTIEDEARVGALSTGIPTLDRHLDGGLRPTRLYIIGARPGAGKSALATNWVRLALDGGRSVLFCSLEMTGPEVLTRLVIERFQISGRTGEPEHVRALMAGMNSDEVSAWRLRYVNLATVGQLISRARDLRADGLDLVVIDYLQLLPQEGHHETRANEIAAYTRALKLMAMELEIPVVALSQLNRSLDSGPRPRKPRLSDLRESGALEQDANVVLLLHRDVDQAAREAELLIAKNRHGWTGKIDLVFNAEHLRFREQHLEAAGAYREGLQK